VDTSFSTDRVFMLRVGPRSFELTEQPVDPPREKRYTLAAADLASDDTLALVAEGDGGILGVAVLRHEEWNRTALLAHLYVHRPARGAGVGRELLREARRLAASLDVRALRVETQTVNLPAVRFYESEGFVLSGVDATLYDPVEAGDEAALYLTLTL
jgi:GNAT superfamily N-acetyltransferase